MNGGWVVDVRAVSVHFVSRIRQRLEKGVFTTDEAVKMTFLASLLERGGLPLHEVIFDYPHPTFAETVDVCVPPTRSRTGLLMQVRYDRETSGKKAVNAKRAARLIHGLSRLAHFSRGLSADRCFVYVTDYAVTAYFRNPRHELGALYEAPSGASLQVSEAVVSRFPPPLRREVGWVVPFGLECLVAEDLPVTHELHVYRVQPADATRRIPQVSSGRRDWRSR
jgi:hypothetical protein